MEKPSDEPCSSDELIHDPVFLDAINESAWILMMWLAAFIWTTSYCALNGYSERVDPATFSTVLGMPAWVVWGIVAPWFIANIVTLWFCFFKMKDGELGPEDDVSVAEGRGENA